MHARRRELAPDIHEAFENFSRTVFADGVLPGKTKQLIAVAVAHVTQCPYCITGHGRQTERRRRLGPFATSHVHDVELGIALPRGGGLTQRPQAGQGPVDADEDRPLLRYVSRLLTPDDPCSQFTRER